MVSLTSGKLLPVFTTLLIRAIPKTNTKKKKKSKSKIKNHDLSLISYYSTRLA